MRLELGLHGSGRASVGIELEDEDQITFELDAEAEPLRLAMDCNRRGEERLVGLGLRHGLVLDLGQPGLPRRSDPAPALGGLHRACLQRALDEVHPGAGVSSAAAAGPVSMPWD